jgi:type II secretory pathway pseudopilin PulG
MDLLIDLRSGNRIRRRFVVKQALPFRVRRHERGYIMLTLMLMVALMIIATAAVLPTISYEIHRDREMEMIHRGVQYSRAIRIYYKKFGRYPTRLEDLDNTNNLRYLRKHYKDPITGKDFKLLHYGDPDVKLSMSFGGGTIPGANTVGQMNASGSSGSALGGNSGFGSPQSSAFGGGSNGAFGGGSNSSFGGGSNSSFGGGSNSAFGGNSNSAFGGSGSFGANSNGNSNSNSSSTPGSSSSDSSSTTPAETSTGPDTPQASAQIAAGSGQGSGGQVFGGGPIVGVASTSKDNAFHEYNHKHKYNEWQFVYDPTADRGGLITTPYQPNLQSFGNQLGQPGQNGQPGSTGTNNSPFGQSNGTGNSSGFGNSGTSGFGNGGFNSGFGNNSGGGTSQPQPQPNPQQPQ